jgi:hypothetical protein
MRFRVFSTLINENSDFFIGHARGRVIGEWDVIAHIGIGKVPQVRGQFHDVAIGIVNHSVTGIGHLLYLYSLAVVGVFQAPAIQLTLFVLSNRTIEQLVVIELRL